MYKFEGWVAVTAVTGRRRLLCLTLLLTGCRVATEPTASGAAIQGSFVRDVRLSELEVPVSQPADAWDINGAGTVVGYVLTSSSTTAWPYQLVVWKSLTPVLLPYPPGRDGCVVPNGRTISDGGVIMGSCLAMTPARTTGMAVWRDDGTVLADIEGMSAADINANDQIAGNLFSGGESHPALWDGGALTLVNGMLTASRINNAGQIAGTALGADGYSHGVVWERGLIRDLGRMDRIGGFNDLGTVAGTALCPHQDVNDYRDFAVLVGSDGVRTEIPIGGFCGNFGSVTGMNNLDQVIGVRGDGNGFVWQAGTLTLLGTTVRPVTINDAGEVVGYYVTEAAAHAFLWDAGGLIDLGSMGTDSWANDISSSGEAVGGSCLDAPCRDFRPIFWTTRRLATPNEELQILTDAVTDLETSGTLSGGAATALRATLVRAQAFLADRKVVGAVNLLRAFQNQVRAFMRGGALSREEGQALIAAAENAIAQLG